MTRVLRSCQGAFKAGVADLLHVGWPSDCTICRAPMLGLSPVRVCDDCVDRVRGRVEPADALCVRCGDALGMESARFAASMGIRECTECHVTPPAFDRAVAFGPYDNEMREMLHMLKFNRMRRVAEHVLGPWLAEAILRLERDAGRELVVIPVPLFRDRQSKRGFNQSELLAEAALKRLARLRPAWKLTLRPEVLLRVKDTRPLYALRPDQRRRNLIGAFRVGDPGAVRGREVLLVDDLLTTGATANVCAKVLLRAGAEKVWVATVARAQPESSAAIARSVTTWDFGTAASEIGTPVG